MDNWKPIHLAPTNGYEAFLWTKKEPECIVQAHHTLMHKPDGGYERVWTAAGGLLVWRFDHFELFIKIERPTLPIPVFERDLEAEEKAWDEFFGGKDKSEVKLNSEMTLGRSMPSGLESQIYWMEGEIWLTIGSKYQEVHGRGKDLLEALDKISTQIKNTTFYHQDWKKALNIET